MAGAARVSSGRASAKEQRARLAVVKAAPVEREVNYADVGEVAEWADTLPDKYLHCREMSHNWRPFDVGHHKDGGFERTLRCVRCRTKKIQHLDTSGMLMGSTRYEHPDGYLHEGMGRIVGDGRGALRLASIRRLMGEVE